MEDSMGYYLPCGFLNSVKIKEKKIAAAIPAAQAPSPPVKIPTIPRSATCSRTPSASE